MPHPQTELKVARSVLGLLACAIAPGLSCAAVQRVTVPMIVEGNAPIIEAQVRHGQHVRTARFLIDTGGGALLIGSSVMADIAAVPSGPEQTEGGDRMVPLQDLIISVGGLELDLNGVKVLGLPAA